MNQETQEITITGQPSTDPHVCKFTVGRTLYPEGSVACTNAESAKGSPLLEALFALDGVREVFVFGKTVTIAKDGSEEWPVLGKKVGQVIRELLASGKRLISPDLKKRLPSETEIRKRVDELLEKEINPYVSGHGGKIEVVDVKGTTVMVSLSGGCQGCASATQTLKHGVERLVF
ncbi:MAG: NifU family protein, partial [candidate division Zixibacteria bacterium]|nr:NifU family protein [candidate division Zixibacteria bacterium]